MWLNERARINFLVRCFLRRGFIFFLMFTVGSLIFINSSFGQEDIFTLGAKQGDGFLLNPREVKEGPDGNIYVLDLSYAFIKVFSPTGKFLRRMGGKGQGPGEIQREEGAYFGFTFDRRLFFTEHYGHRWITLMELSGKLYKVVHIGMSQSFGIHKALSLNDGGFILEILLIPKPERRKEYMLHRASILLLRINEEGKVISKINKTEYYRGISSLERGGDQPIPFSPRIFWDLYNKEENIVFSDSLSTYLKLLNFNGEEAGQIETKLPEPEKVKQKDFDNWRKRQIKLMKERDSEWYAQFGRVIEKYDKSVHKKKPNISSLEITPDGNILIGVPKTANYWLLDYNGRLITRVFPRGWRLRITKFFIFFITQGKDGNYLVQCMPRKGSEEQDLQRLSKVKSLEGS